MSAVFLNPQLYVQKNDKFTTGIIYMPIILAYLISHFKKQNVIGVEPCSNLAKITKKKGFTTYDNYWEFKLAKKLKKKYKKIDLIYSANTLTDISDLKDVFKSIDLLLSTNGILIIEDPSLLECLK